MKIRSLLSAVVAVAVLATAVPAAAQSAPGLTPSKFRVTFDVGSTTIKGADVKVGMANGQAVVAPQKRAISFGASVGYVPTDGGFGFNAGYWQLKSSGPTMSGSASTLLMFPDQDVTKKLFSSTPSTFSDHQYSGQAVLNVKKFDAHATYSFCLPGGDDSDGRFTVFGGLTSIMLNHSAMIGDQQVINEAPDSAGNNIRETVTIASKGAMNFHGVGPSGGAELRYRIAKVAIQARGEVGKVSGNADEQGSAFSMTQHGVLIKGGQQVQDLFTLNPTGQDTHPASKLHSALAELELSLRYMINDHVEVGGGVSYLSLRDAPLAPSWVIPANATPQFGNWVSNTGDLKFASIKVLVTLKY